MYKFATLDPRPIPAATEANDVVFADDAQVLGIEVTVSALAARCSLGNLDHHGSGDDAQTPSAVEQALTVDLPPEGTTFATVRADADSVSAMAVLMARMAGFPVNESLVAAIGQMDRLGPKVEAKLPHREIVVAISRKSADFRTPLVDRVQFVLDCMNSDTDVSEQVASLVAQRDADYAAALEGSDVREVIPGKLVFVQSTHQFAPLIGYHHADTVVAFNPTMAVIAMQDGRLQPTGETYAKYTISRRDSNVPTDLPTALAELQTLEEDWGGRGDIFGSPQNTSSALTPEQVIEIVKRYVR